MRETFRADEIDTCQLHELQNVEAHPDGSRQGGSVPPIDTGLGGLDHSLDIAVSHRSTVTFESFSKNMKEARGVPDAMVYFLLNQVWVQYRSYVARLRCEFIESGLERGRSDCRIEDAGRERLDDGEEDFQKF